MQWLDWAVTRKRFWEVYESNVNASRCPLLLAVFFLLRINGFWPQLLQVRTGSTCIIIVNFLFFLSQSMVHVLWLDSIVSGLICQSIQLGKVSLVESRRSRPNSDRSCFCKLHVCQSLICRVAQYIRIWEKNELDDQFWPMRGEILHFKYVKSFSS